MIRPSDQTDPRDRDPVMGQLLSVVWPFLLTTVGCVLLALLSMQLMSAGRAYVGGESLWSKGQKNAVLHLGEYALTCNPQDYVDYESALAVPKGDRIARLALQQTVPDMARAREGFIQGQNDPSDVDGMIMLFLRLGHVSYMSEAIRIWSAADVLIDELEQAAQRLRDVVQRDCRDEAGKTGAMAAILEINERLTPLQRAFSDTVGQANRLVHLVTGSAVLLVAGIFTVWGVMRSMRVQGRYAQAQRRLADSEQRYQLAVAGSRQGLWDLDTVSGHLFVSPEAERMLELEEGTFGNHRQDFIKRLHPQEREDVVQQLNALIAQGQSFETELRVMDGTGQYRWVRTAGRARIGATGRAVRVLGSIQDISARRALEDRLREQTRSREAAIDELLQVLRRDLATGGTAGSGGTLKGAEVKAAGDNLEEVSHLVAVLVGELQQRGQHLDAIFALSPDGFVSFDSSRRVNHVNEAFTRLTGLPEAAALGLQEAELGQRLAALLPAGARMPDLAELRERLQDGLQQRLPRVELERPAQRVIELQWRMGEDASIPQVLYLRDVTIETEVERIKSEFLSTAAHELRTPMASIIGFSELLLMRSYPAAKQTELLQTVHRQAERMASIVDELLDLARIEARRGKDFVIERAPLARIVDEALRDQAVPTGRNRPVWHVPDGHSALVDVDRSKLLQALGNVLSNAYKYSPDGGEVRVELVGDHDHAAGTANAPRAMVGIRVTDSGIGLKPEQLARMGERFYRADTSGRIPGTGLGVSIVQEILQILGGRVEFRSTWGQGTQVTLWLPQQG